MAQSGHGTSSAVACLLKSTGGTRPSCTKEILRLKEQDCSVTTIDRKSDVRVETRCGWSTQVIN